MADLSKVLADLQIRIEHLEGHVALLEERLNYECGMRTVELDRVGSVELVSESSVCSINEETTD